MPGLDANSTFYDIGSGLGRLAWFVRLSAPELARVVGVERNRCRHERALGMLDAALDDSLRDSLAAEGSDTADTVGSLRYTVAIAESIGNLSFVHDDIRSVGLPDATHAFMTPVCFSRTLLRDIVALASRAAAPRLRCLISFGQPLPAGEARSLAEGAGLKLRRAEPLAATFQAAGANAFYYTAAPWEQRS